MQGFHVIPSGKKWRLTKTGAKKATHLFMTRDAAWIEAQAMAENVAGVAYLHDADGRIIERQSYDK